MRKTKVCAKHNCKAKGARQNVDNFRVIPGNTSGYSSVCKNCLYKANNELAHASDVTVLGNGLYIINNLRYKLWDNGFVFFHDGFEFIRSANNKDWLDRNVRLYAQA